MSDPRILPVFYKYSGARIDIDFRIESDDDDTVDSVDVPVVSPAGSLACDDVDTSGATVKVWLTGGTDEADYDLLVPIHTTLGRIEYGEAIIKVRD